MLFRSKKWEQLPKRALDRLDRKASSSLPQIDREIEQEATLFAKQLDRMVLPYCNLVAEMMRTAFASDRRTTLVRRGDISGVVCSDVGSKWEIPFDCQVSQWTWEESARIPTIAVWTFHPNSTAIFQIHVERKFANTPESEEGSFLHMVCLWNVDASSSMEIDEYNRERLVRIVAPLSPDEMELPEDRAPLPKLELSYRHLNRMTGPGGQPAIPISFETVAIEPRSLFEIEKTLRDRQQKWLNRVHSEATQVVERLCSTRLASMLDERSHRSASWLEQLSKLDSELMGWQKRWDASEVQPQFRVGNRLAGHPDAYLLPQQSHSNTARKIPSDERTFR